MLRDFGSVCTTFLFSFSFSLSCFQEWFTSSHLIGLRASASETQVRTAYRKLALKNHPDKNPDDKEGASARFVKISEAYKRVTDPDSFKNDEEGYEMDEEAMNAMFEDFFEELFARRFVDKTNEMDFSDEDEEIPVEVMAMMQEMIRTSPDLRSDMSDDEDENFPRVMDDMMMMMNLMDDKSMGGRPRRGGSSNERNRGRKDRMATRHKKMDLKRVINKEKSSIKANDAMASREKEDSSDDSWESVFDSDSDFESDGKNLFYNDLKTAAFGRAIENIMIYPAFGSSRSEFPDINCHIDNEDDDSSVDCSVENHVTSCALMGSAKNSKETSAEFLSKYIDTSFASALENERAKSQPLTLHVGDCVNYRSKRGKVVFIGEVHYTRGVMIGVIMNDQVGKNDGLVKGQRYFECTPGYGLMVRASELSLVDTCRGSAV